MVTASAFRVMFESSIKRSEKKVAGPTVSLLREILINAGMDEGEWSLRDSRRIKKKGRERFHAIRVEERSGRKSVRIWCKPGGNDSCFEYTLLPPTEVDTNVLFALLRRVSPVNLEIPESRELPRAFIDHVIDAKPNIFLPRPLARANSEADMTEELDPEAEESKELNSEADESQELDSEAEAEIREAVQDLDRLGHGSNSNLDSDSKQIAQAVSLSREHVAALLLDEPSLMSDQEVMDKALLALSIVAPNGYAKKTEASNSIIESLGIKRFVGKVSGGVYTSVEGAMRALTMALRSAGYLERVHYAAENGSVSKGIKGYKLTPKALRRIAALKAARGGASPSEPARHEEIEDAHDSEPLQGVLRETSLNSEDLPKLKSLISQHEEADLQLREIDGILRNLDSEIADIELDATGLDLAERDKMKQIEVLQGEIQRVREKKMTVDANLERKHKERKDWEDMRSPHLSEKSRVETEICTITGRNKR
jgi:hypothetical protein